MTKDVIVSILGLHIEGLEEENTNEPNEQNEPNEPIEVIASANYFFRNGKHYVLYEEVEEDISNVTKNQIKITGGTKVELRKKGVHTTNMVFEKGEKNFANYQTPFGEIALGVHTTSMQVQEDEDKLVVNVKYRLEANGEYLSDSKLTICIKNK